MNYKVILFTKGHPVWQGEIPAKSAKQAAVSAAAQAIISFTHAQVVGKKNVERYDRKFQKVKGDIFAFRTSVMYKPSILLQVGSVPELYRFDDDKKRDQIFEELCTISASVESVKVDEEPTNITAFSAVTFGSKSGLTCQKILNGSVTSATWQEKLTQSSIDKVSGKDNAKDSAKLEWSGGSKASPSKQTRTFLATVKSTLPQPGKEYVTLEMHNLVGQTIVVFSEENDYYPEYSWVGAGWYWKQEWLDFEKVYAFVKSVSVYEEKDGVTFIGSMRNKIGKVIRLRPCVGSDPQHYTCDGWCFAQDWLQPMGVQQYSDNFKATQTYLKKKKLEEISDKIYQEKKYVKELPSAYEELKEVKKKFASKYAEMPFKVEDITSTAVDPKTVQPPLTIEEFKKITQKIKETEHQAIIESPWMDLSKAIEEDLKTQKEKKLKFNTYYDTGGS